MRVACVCVEFASESKHVLAEKGRQALNRDVGSGSEGMLASVPVSSRLFLAETHTTTDTPDLRPHSDTSSPHSDTSSLPIARSSSSGRSSNTSTPCFPRHRREPRNSITEPCFGTHACSIAPYPRRPPHVATTGQRRARARERVGPLQCVASEFLSAACMCRFRVACRTAPGERRLCQVARRAAARPQVYRVDAALRRQ